MTFWDVLICIGCMLTFGIGGYFLGEFRGEIRGHRQGYMTCVSEEDGDEIRNYSGRPRVEVKL